MTESIQNCPNCHYITELIVKRATVRATQNIQRPEDVTLYMFFCANCGLHGELHSSHTSAIEEWGEINDYYSKTWMASNEPKNLMVNRPKHKIVSELMALKQRNRDLLLDIAEQQAQRPVVPSTSPTVVNVQDPRPHQLSKELLLRAFKPVNQDEDVKVIRLFNHEVLAIQLRSGRIVTINLQENDHD